MSNRCWDGRVTPKHFLHSLLTMHDCSPISVQMVYSPKSLSGINIDWVEADEECSSGDTDCELQCNVTVFTVDAGAAVSTDD